jgi:hypothetical protein
MWCDRRLTIGEMQNRLFGWDEQSKKENVSRAFFPGGAMIHAVGSVSGTIHQNNYFVLMNSPF